MRVHWFLPTAGDGRDVAPTDPASRRDPSLEYLVQVAQAAEHLGFAGVLTPTGSWCEDAWITTAALTRETERLQFLVAFRPGFISPTLAAQMASTYQRISNGRLLLNVVTGGNPGEQRRFGDWLDHDARYERTGEFLAILRGAWSGEPFDFKGAHYEVEGATTLLPPDPLPEIYFGGASPAAEVVAAEGTDVYLAWGEPPAMIAERLERMRERAATAGRTLRFGLRVHVISRDRADDAWAQADRLLEGMDDDVIATRRRRPPARSRSVSSGWPRCTAGARTTSSSPRTCGRGSVSCAAARAPRSSAATTRSPSGCASTPTSASRSSSSRASRTSKRRTGSARACSPSSDSAASRRRCPRSAARRADDAGRRHPPICEARGMRVTRVGHVSVNVEGALDETRTFYADVLGLGDRERPEIPGVGGHWHGIGDVELHLVDAAQAGHGIDPTGPHFCVYVDDLDAAIRELDERAIPHLDARQGEVVQVWITDPAGNTVELQEDRAG